MACTERATRALGFAVALAAVACGQPAEDEVTGNDSALVAVQMNMERGAIAMFTFDEDKPGCADDPVTMSPEVFSECTSNVGLPTEVTKDFRGFDPTKALERVYVLRSAGADGTPHWFGIVGLGPKEQAQEALSRLNAATVDLRGSRSSTASGKIRPAAAQAALLLAEPPVALALLVVGGIAWATMTNEQRDLVMHNVIEAISRSLTATSEADASVRDRCARAVAGSLVGGAYQLRSRCSPADSRTFGVPIGSAAGQLGAYWGFAPKSVCVVDEDYLEEFGLPVFNGGSMAWSYYKPSVDVVQVYRPVDLSVAETVGFTMPHEWGHVFQQRVYRGNVPGGPSARELQADCLAGVFVGAQSLAGLAVEGAGTAICKVEFTAPFPEGSQRAASYYAAHGTCAQRLAAYTRGLHFAREEKDRACSSNVSRRAAWATMNACPPGATY